jgi:hypothetical protein
VSQLETSISGNPLRTINAQAGNESYTLPAGFASGRTVTVRREDSGTNGTTVTVSAPAGASLDGVVNGSAMVPGDSQLLFMCVNPGAWETYGKPGGGGATGDLLPETVTYNGDGTVATSTVGGVTTTYTYSGGNVLTEARNGKTKTYSYDGSGNATGAVVA